jgi:superfamily II DNA or RNA helicase
MSGSIRTLRPHQLLLKENLREAIRNGAISPLVMSATGTGKSVNMADIAASVLDKDRILPDGTKRKQRIAVTVPFVQLIPQMQEHLWNAGIREDIGVYQADHPLYNPAARLQLCSVDTLSSRKLRPEADVLLVDEAHVRKKWLIDWIAERKAKRQLTVGWSATPFAVGLGLTYDALVTGSGMRPLINAGVLSDFDIFTPGPAGVKPDLSKVKTAKNIDGETDYVESQVAKVMSAPPLVADALATLLSKARGRKVLCFTVNRNHGKVITERYTAAGIACGYIDGKTPALERKRIIRQLELGDIDVIVSIGCLTTGFDLPSADCIQLLRPTKSPSLLLQILGRGMRPFPGKRLLVLDHTTSVSALGFPDDIADEFAQQGLDDGKVKPTAKRKPKERYELPQECTRCGALRRPQVKVCPGCGLEFKPFTKIKEAAGELKQATRKAKSKKTMEEKASMYNALVWWGQTRKCPKTGKPKPYHKGWRYHAFRAWNDGVNVPGKVQASARAAPPTPEQEAWIKRYMNSQMAAEIAAKRKSGG